MKTNKQTEVLVVGAGPVGMFTAMRLAEGGIDVQLIDQEPCTGSRSFACALHPRTLQLLDEVGVAQDAIRLGHRIDKIAFYEGNVRRTELDLSNLLLKFPYILVLEQNILEDLLEKKLSEKSSLAVHWNHRLSDLVMKEDSVMASIDELTMSGKGYGVADFDTTIKKTVPVSADFVVGADGQGSIVRQRLGIGYEMDGAAQTFVVYEFQTEKPLPQEVRIILGKDTVNILWPFGENKCRWSFQWLPADGPSDFPQKERNQFTISKDSGTGHIREHLDKLLEDRAPWFEFGIKDITWATTIQFEHKLATRFGKDRAWLAGDAAHQTGPVGIQSMNMGFREGANLADLLTRILRGNDSTETLETYNNEFRAEWEHLLGWKGAPKATAGSAGWIQEYCSRLPECVPASGMELTWLLCHLGIEFDYTCMQAV